MRVLFYIILGAVAFVLYVRYLERMSVFYPDREIKATPADAGLKYEEAYFETQDNVKLNGWFVPYDGAASTVLFFHGNAGNNGDRIDTIEFFHDLGLNVFIVDYRGYGKSQGHPTEKGLYLDAQAGYDYLRHKRGIPGENIISYGASLGGVAAIDVAAKNPVGALFLDSVFTNAADMAQVIYPFIPTAIMSLKLDNLEKIKGIKAPKVFVHSQNDETTPYYLGKKLFDAAAEPKSFITVSGGHNDIRNGRDSEAVTLGAREFLQKYRLN